MAELLIENLSRSFGRRNEVRALDQLSLRVASGEFLVLLGPSGSGKTTALRLIAGLEKPDAGSMQLDGRTLAQIPPQDRGIGMAFQYPALLPQLSVSENLTLGLKLRGVPQRERLDRMQHLAGLLGITDLLQRKPESLSGGQQQRAALARALLSQPRLLLLDEPLANLDPLARHELRQVIRRLHRELRVTTLYVTHDQAEAVELADRIALLDGGRLQQVGTPLDLYANPANLFAARFIGMDGLNTLEGRLTTEPRPGIEIGKDGLSLPVLNWKSIPTDVSVTAGFRPDSVQRSTDGLPCLVEEVRDHGWKKTAFLRIGDRQILADCRALGEIRSGDPVIISLAAFFAFDPVSGQRLA